jgi:hypothetical protein
VTNVNGAPVLTAAANRTDAEQATVSLALVASDPDEDALTYSATGLPSGLTVNAATGVIAGTLSPASAGTHAVTVTVSDGDLTSTQTFTWTITNVNRPPAMTVVADQTHAENAAVSLQLLASDPDDDTLTYGATGLPSGLILDVATGLISGTVLPTSVSMYAVTASASDGDMTSAQTFSWTIANLNHAPVLSTLSDRTDSEPATIVLPLTASDPDDDPLTYAATGLPPGLTVEAATGVIAGDLSHVSVGTHLVTAMVSDGDRTTSQPFTWTVRSPTTPPPPATIVIHASDVPAGALHGSWSHAADAASPDGVKLVTSDTGVQHLTSPVAAPTDYFDVTFEALPDTPYTLWLRLQAKANSKWNDAVWVQFSGARANGVQVYPLHSGSGLLVNLATDTTAASLNGWGWQTTAYWLSQATTVTFPAGGMQTLRIQVREDGVELDQIVLRPDSTLPPGGPTADSTIVAKPGGPGVVSVPGGPMPADRAADVSMNPTLTWTATGATSFDVRFAASNPPADVSAGQLATTYTPPILAPGTTYYWQVVARHSSATTEGRVWSFTTGAPPPLPATPAAPVPAAGAVDVTSHPTFTWSASGATSFDVRFGPTNPPTEVSTGQSPASYTPETLAPSTTYYWQVVARNSSGTTDGPIWSFTTGATPPPPTAPAAPAPADAAVDTNMTPTLTWTAIGATTYDVRFGTATPLPIASTGQTVASYTPAALAAATTYFWQVVAHNAAGITIGPVWSFTTAAPPPSGNIVIYASDVPSTALHGSWTLAPDSASPGGVAVATSDLGVQHLNQPLPAPTDYFDVTFNATAGTPYAIWIRLKALGNSKWNDAVWVQFSGARANGSPVYRIGTSSGLLVNLATDAAASGLSAWGWQNTAYWLNQPSTVTFASTGPQTIRIQVREDGVQLDQIVLSPTTYLGSAPGPASNDTFAVPRN